MLNIMKDPRLSGLQSFLFFSLSMAAFSTVFTGCSDKEIAGPEQEVEVDGVVFNKLFRVENFAMETDDANPTVPKTAVYYSLEERKDVALVNAKTTRWDIAFNGLYNSFISGNNGKDETNAGFGSNGTGGVMIVQKPYNEVVDIPADAEFKTGGGLIGTDDAGAFGQGTGWYLYDFGGSLVATGADKQHVAYALGHPLKLLNGATIPARTIIVRTAKGNYAKIKMISCYKDAFTPDLWFKNTPHMYFTFEYTLAQKGSTKFK